MKKPTTARAQRSSTTTRATKARATTKAAAPRKAKAATTAQAKRSTGARATKAKTATATTTRRTKATTAQATTGTGRRGSAVRNTSVGGRGIEAIVSDLKECFTGAFASKQGQARGAAMRTPNRLLAELTKHTEAITRQTATANAKRARLEQEVQALRSGQQVGDIGPQETIAHDQSASGDILERKPEEGGDIGGEPWTPGAVTETSNLEQASASRGRRAPSRRNHSAAE